MFIDPNDVEAFGWFPQRIVCDLIPNYEEWNADIGRGSSFLETFTAVPTIRSYWMSGFGELKLINNWWYYEITFTGDGVD